MSDPLTHEHFNEWRRSEFMPHTQREEEYERKVDRLWWTALTALFMGGTVLAIFMWVLLQKNNQIDQLQHDTHQLAVNQAVVVETLRIHQAEIARVTVGQTTLTQALIDTLKQQGELHKR